MLDSSFEKQPRSDYESEAERQISQIEFQEVDTEAEADITVSVRDEDTKEDIKKKLIEKVKRQNWWLQEKWLNKDQPTEQIDFSTADTSLSLYSFLENELNTEQVEKIKGAVSEFRSVQDKSPLQEIDYILVNEEQKFNPNDGSKQNGERREGIKSIILYPNAFVGEHRIPGVTNLEGTIIHEFGHIIEHKVRKEWKDRFGWYRLEEFEQLPGEGYVKTEKTDQPERCVTDYAKLGSDEDICESLVAALRNPNVLDDEKLSFIQENLLNDTKEQKAVGVSRYEEPKLPHIDNEITFKRRRGLTFDIKNRES